MDTVAQWMTTPAIVAPETMTVPAARLYMREEGIRRLPVVDRAGRLVGIVTEGDISHVSGSPETDVQSYDLQHTIQQLPIGTIMTCALISVAPDTPLAEAARLMWAHRISGLPVVAHDRVVGVLSASDLFRFVMATEQPTMELADYSLFYL